MTEKQIPPLFRGTSDGAGRAADRYEELAALAAGRAQKFARAFTTKLVPLDIGWISLTELEDDFHSMRIAMVIAPEGTITEASGRMHRNPYDTCPRALESLAALAGANLSIPGAHNQIKERIGRIEGCLHLVDMLTVAFRAFRISHGHDIPYTGESGRETLLTIFPHMRDTCLSFAIDHTGPNRD